MNRSLIDPGDFSLADVVRPFARYYWVVLVTVAACLIGTLAFLYYKPVAYTSASVIVVGAVDPVMVADLMRARNGRAVEVDQLSGGLLTLTFTAASPEQAVSRLRLLIDQARRDIVNLLPDYETRMAIAQEEFDQLTALALDSQSPEESMYLTGPAAALTRIIFDLRAGEPNEAKLLTVLEEPSVPLQPDPRFLPVNIVLAVVLGMALGALGVYIANARDTILQRKQSLATNGIEVGQPTQEIHPGGHALSGTAQANGGNGNGGSASSHS